MTLDPGTPSLADPVAAIAVGPAGPRVGAFFDVDGTLVDGFTPVAHARHRIRNRQATIGEVLGVVEAAVRYRLGRMEFDRLVVRAGGYLGGTPLVELEELGEQLFHRHNRVRMFQQMEKVVAAHQRRGHTVVLSSSALTVHAVPVARALGVTDVICNHFEVDEHGRLTGGIVKPIIWGRRKAEAVRRFSAEHRVELPNSYFYADGDEDAPLMHEVGNPRPVNPRPGLAAAAARAGWPVLRVTRPGRRGAAR